MLCLLQLLFMNTGSKSKPWLKNKILTMDVYRNLEVKRVKTYCLRL
jgi:hypothetical protein